MSRYLDPAVQSALEQRRLVARDFIWFVVKDRETGAAVTEGYWSDVGNVSAQVISPDSGAAVTRTFYGAGGLISIADIPMVANLTVQSVEVRLSQIADRVNDLIRGYEAKQGRVEIFRGLFDPDSRNMVAPAICRFVGYIDEIRITTPAEGGEGGVALTCKSSTQELTRANSETRSAAYQVLRDPGDAFFNDAAVVGNWPIFWGKQDTSIPTVPAGRVGAGAGGGAM